MTKMIYAMKLRSIFNIKSLILQILLDTVELKSQKDVCSTLVPACLLPEDVQKIVS